METKAKFLTTKQMTLIALMTALTCILGPLSIPLPFSPVIPPPKRSRRPVS